MELPVLRVAPKETPNYALLALPNYSHAEKIVEERLKVLEKCMEECAYPSVNVALEVLDVTVSEHDEELRQKDYHQYAMVAIKNAEKRLREEALTFHPDMWPNAWTTGSISNSGDPVLHTKSF